MANVRYGGLCGSGLRGRVPRWVIDEAAEIIASDMLRRAERRGLRLTEPGDMVMLATTYGADVDAFHRPGGASGWYLLSTATIAYNTARSPLGQCRTICHETGHHILCRWTGPLLRGGADMFRYEDDPAIVQHQIARGAECHLYGNFTACDLHALRSI